MYEAVVSIYPHIKDTKSTATMLLSDIFASMQSGHWKEKFIEPLRVRISEGASEEEISKLKSKLPYFTASGAFKERNDKGLIQHSGKLALDFDKVENHELVRKILTNDKHSEYVFLSCTGRGYCVIVNVDPEKHLESFLFMEKYYKECYGLEVDKACKDLSRPRYISYDENLFYNPDYERVRVAPEYSTTTIDNDDEKYEWVKADHSKKHPYEQGKRHQWLVIFVFYLNKAGVNHAYTQERIMADYLPEMQDEKELQRIIRDCYKNINDFGQFAISKKISDMPPEDAERLRAIYAFANGRNEAGEKWTEGDINSLCAQHCLSADTVRGIFKSVFEKNKDLFGLDKKEEIFKIELFIKKRYEVLRNEVTQRLEARRAKTQDKFDKLNTDSVSRDIQHAGMKFPLDKLKSLLRSDFVAEYNPFRVYFESLPEWDGVDYISELASFIKTDNDEFWNVQFKKALVRCIACSLDHIENRIIITLVGQAQETGKSNFIRFLCPPALKEYYTETAMDGGKDSDIQLSQNLIWNLEELAALHNKEINHLKAIISKSIVKQRNPYGEFSESNPRRVNFWASTNKAEFLTDDQNTRWLCFNVVSIDHDYNNFKTNVRKVNINNVWAQAYSLYKAGFDFNLTKEEAAQRDLNNKAYELSSTEKELIIEHYRQGQRPAHGEVTSSKFVTNTDILIHLQNETGNKIKLWPGAIGKAMRQLEFLEGSKRLNNKCARGYWVIQVDKVNSTDTINFEPTPTKPSTPDQLTIDPTIDENEKPF